ncbi:MAG: hypothetical protein IPM61_16885 [Chlorobi bacterium]|nr:hypothetical protein [Chlorobiota bacterium]
MIEAAPMFTCKRVTLKAIQRSGDPRRIAPAWKGRDNGWTGRLDTTLSNPDARVPGTKRYAFGVEGVSARLRRAVGKGYLTDARLIRDTVDILNKTEERFYGRAAWHLISGLPMGGGIESTT